MSTNRELQRIKSALVERPKKPGRWIPPDVRRRIGRYARSRITAGVSKTQVATEVGVDSGTIVRYMRLEDDIAEQFLPVRVPVRTPNASTVTVHGPSGLTIEGLDVDGIAALVRALS